MPAAKPALQTELRPDAESEIHSFGLADVAPSGPRRLAEASAIRVLPTSIGSRKEVSFQPRVPAITGEVHYRGVMAVDGIVSGQLGAASTLTIKQRPRPESEPELNGELSFKDMLRINGHVG